VGVGSAVVPDEPGRGARIGAQHRAAHQVRYMILDSCVDGVPVPGQLVVRGGTEQEHLGYSGHRGGERIRPGQVPGDTVRIGWFLVPGQYPDRGSGAV
jgi:hypothetical protein